MTKVITVARQYGSGGGEIARRVASKLGWRVVDRELIAEVARLARVSPEDAVAYDEQPASWLARLLKGFWAGAPDAPVGRHEVIDADRMAALAREAIEQAAGVGGCVIVGRGGQCILARRPGVFHVFVYAPLEERLARVRERYKAEAAALEALDDIERLRGTYMRRYYGAERLDPDWYDIMLNSRVGLEHAAEAIVCASGVRKAPA